MFCASFSSKSTRPLKLRAATADPAIFESLRLWTVAAVRVYQALTGSDKQALSQLSVTSVCHSLCRSCLYKVCRICHICLSQALSQLSVQGLSHLSHLSVTGSVAAVWVVAVGCHVTSSDFRTVRWGKRKEMCLFEGLFFQRWGDQNENHPGEPSPYLHTYPNGRIFLQWYGTLSNYIGTTASASLLKRSTNTSSCSFPGSFSCTCVQEALMRANKNPDT